MGWLYLIRNGDLYKIGITKNIDIRMRQLKPDYVVAKLYTKDFKQLEREFHDRYKEYRIPQTEYFRLKNYHLKEIKQRISKLDYPMIIILEMLIKSILSILLICFLVFIFISLYINDVNVVIINSLFWMEYISFGLSILSIFIHSGKYLNFISELKYRVSRSFVYILFFFFFRTASNYV